MSKELKRPWIYHDGLARITSAEGVVVVEGVDPQTAEVILQAVNNHDKLMRTIEDARRVIRAALNLHFAKLEKDIVEVQALAKVRQTEGVSRAR